jgi:PAS domain S-box-containing protein
VTIEKRYQTMGFPWQGSECFEKKPLVHITLIALSTVFVIFITFFALSLGITAIFQNLYYIPIILACYYYQRKGLYLSIILVSFYFFSLLAYFPALEIFYQGFIRVLFFLLVAGIVTHLSETITKENARYQGIFSGSESGILLWERDSGRITEANPEASRISGYPASELVRMTIFDLCPDRPLVETVLSGKEGPIRHREADIRHSDGTRRIVAFSSAWIDDDTGMVTFQDITEKKRAEEAISLSNRKLNLLNSITRHDILNTMTALLGYLEISREIARDDELKKYIDSATRAAATIRRQVEFSRDYQDVGVRSPDWFSLHVLIENQKQHIEQSGIKVEADLPDIRIYADPLIEKVFYNLMENSVRHGGNVRRIWFTTGLAGEDLVIRYCDDGKGIPDDKKEAIFNREYFQHSGFGLFLSREILAITGIRIRETGTFGQGAVFEIVVPPGSYRITDSKKKAT